MRHRIGWTGETPYLYLGSALGDDVRINTGILNCVCFLGVYATRNGQGEFEVAGTGFFVAVGDHLGKKNATYYLVTAKHVALAGIGKGGLHARINRKDGTFQYVPLRDLNAEWVMSDEADVAAMVFALQGARDDHLDYTLIHQEEFATDEWLSATRIEPSDAIAVTGLFVPHKGEGQNQPIIRGGSIAAMPNPNEPLVATSKTLEIIAPAYLLELHSSGGLSGSPVLVMTEPHRATDGTIRQRTEGTKLLALIGGHWHLELPFKMRKEVREQFSELNRGIALGTPIQALSRLLAREDVVQDRTNRWAAKARQRGAVLDTALDENSDDDQTRSGRPPERLIIGRSMDDAVRKMFEAGKPPKN